MLAKFVRAVLLVVGVLIALQASASTSRCSSVFGGALGVGIGLGLQKLASNYIAGFTILLDRSIRLGDMITVDNRFGVVTKVTARYVVVRSLDGVEAIVPNETLVTTTVLNHSYSARESGSACRSRSRYDTDLERALQLMVEAARGEPRVLTEPNPPAAFVVRFADSGIDLELGFWINDPENGQGNLRSAINLRDLARLPGQRHQHPVPAARGPDRRRTCAGPRGTRRAGRACCRRRQRRNPGRQASSAAGRLRTAPGPAPTQGDRRRQGASARRRVQ